MLNFNNLNLTDFQDILKFKLNCSTAVAASLVIFAERNIIEDGT